MWKQLFPAGWCTPTYSECHLGCPAWSVCKPCPVKYYFQSALAVAGSGHHVHQTWIPKIISFGATLNIEGTAPTLTLFRSCKQKLKLLLKRSYVTCCVTQLTISGSFTRSPQGRRMFYWTCVHMETTWTQTVHETELSFVLYFCTIENYTYTVHRN
jgi:hypothetical protein